MLKKCLFVGSLFVGISCSPVTESSNYASEVEVNHSISLIDYSILKDETTDTPGKTQVEIELLVTQDSLSENQLRKLLNRLFVEVLNRKGFQYHPHPTNIYIYAFNSKEKANSGMGQWIAMCSKGPLDQRPSISISEVQLRAQSTPIEEKFGLTEELRETIWTEIVKAEDQAQKDADEKFPLYGSKFTKGNIDGNIEYSLAAIKRYHLELARKHSITPEIIDSISLEGISKGWAFPKY